MEPQRNYGKDVPKLDDAKIRYVIKAREKGESASDIARNLLVSKRRVEQLYSDYRKKGTPPVLHPVGRKRVELTENECKIILDVVINSFEIHMLICTGCNNLIRPIGQ